MFDINSFWFIFTSFVFLAMCAVVFRTPKRAKTVLLGTILSSAVVMIFQGLRLFLPLFWPRILLSKILSLGVLADKTGNLVGSWNTFGIFAGFCTLMFLLVTEFFPISKKEKIVLQVFILLSIVLAACVDFPLVWIILGISSLIIFVYKVSISLSHKTEETEEEKNKKHFPLTSFVVMLVALLFFISGQFIGNYIPTRLQISNTEIGPSFGTTMSITKAMLAKHPILGIGPNRFGEAWAMYKPLSINQTQFWDVAFNSASGLLPTLAVTAGGLGILAWVIFLILFLMVGVKSVFSSVKNGANWEMMAFFVLSLYLFISSFFYITGSVVFLLSLAFAGIFVGLATSNSGREISMTFLNDHRKSFFSILILILVVILSVALAFKYIERFASAAYFGKAISAQTEAAAEYSINQALALYTNDSYLRTYAEIYLIKVSSVANKSNLSDQDKVDLNNSFKAAVAGATLATTTDSQNYLNFQMLGNVYQTLGTLGIKDVYGPAITAYKNASTLNPLNPGIQLSLATSSFLNGNIQDAKYYAKQALTLKPDYVDAFVALSRIAQSEGNTTDALSYAQSALSLSPADKNLIQYVNSLGGYSTPSSTSPASTPTKTKK